MDEKFSAFLDNEATGDEVDSVIGSLLRDESLRISWTRQHLIRDTLRGPAGDLPLALDMNFAERVMQAVRDEDIMADVDGDHPTVVSMPHRASRRRWRTVTGFAVAASAVGIALFVTQPMHVGTGTTPATITASTQSSPFTDANSPGATTVAATGMGNVNAADTSGSLTDSMVQNVAAYVDAAQDAADRWHVSNQILANRLNGYLVEHSGLARGFGLGATKPGFVRVATYGQDSAR